VDRQLALSEGQPDDVIVLALELLGQFLHGEHSETLRQQSMEITLLPALGQHVTVCPHPLSPVSGPHPPCATGIAFSGDSPKGR
jgi:hypothetical protein